MISVLETHEKLIETAEEFLTMAQEYFIGKNYIAANTIFYLSNREPLILIPWILRLIRLMNGRIKIYKDDEDSHFITKTYILGFTKKARKCREVHRWN
jgi:hypothetical protein